MISAKAWIPINISLALIILLLILNLAGAELPTIGKAQYFLDKNEPACAVNWKDQFTEWNDLDRCCLEARKQLGCNRESYLNYDWACSSGNELKYWLNNKAYNYCRQLSIW